MKTSYKVVLAALAIVSSTSAARADLTQQGAVGLPLNPTAQLPPEGTWRVQAHYADLGDIDGSDFSIRNYGVFGAGRLGNRLEINGGVNRVKPSDFFLLSPLEETDFAIGAKYLLTRESDAGLRLAIGAGHDRAYARNTYAYVVGTKSFGRGISGGKASITAHLGVRWDKFDFDYIEPGFEDSSKVSVYGGVEVPLTRSGSFTFVGELQSKNDEFGYITGDDAKMPYSASVRFRPAGAGFSASLGWQRRNFPAFSSEGGFFAQLGYTFGEGEGSENENDD